MNIVERAKDIATRAHAGQVDKAGRSYIEHVARVAAAVADDPEAEAVAWLHDVLEDGDHDSGREVMQFPDRVKYAVTLLTRCTDYDYSIYYGEILGNPLALRVKLADIASYDDESRLSMLDEETSARLRKKYAKAMRILAPQKKEQPE